jgi:very-short-patch-repair endonuclease
MKGARFRRQYSVGGYVLEFFCPELKLGIKVDGAVHETQKEYDAFRDSSLATLGIRLLRFTNNEIAHDLNGVVSRIMNIVDRCL